MHSKQKVERSFPGLSQRDMQLLYGKNLENYRDHIRIKSFSGETISGERNYDKDIWELKLSSLAWFYFKKFEI